MLARVFLSVALSVALALPAAAIDKDVEIEIRRLDHQLSRIDDTNRQIQKDLRTLQRTTENLSRLMEEIEKKHDDLIDAVVKMQNVDMSNLKSGQQKLYDQIPLFTWGQDTEGCTDIGADHQQIRSVQSADKSRTLRYLCYDGKALHLGTELNLQPE